MSNFQINEKHLSQIPAAELLINLGNEYLSPGEALKERQNRTSGVLLENILLKQLAEKYKTQKHGLMQKMLTGEWQVKEEIIKQYSEA